MRSLVGLCDSFPISCSVSKLPRESEGSGMPGEDAGSGMPGEDAGSGIPGEDTGSRIPEEDAGSGMATLMSSLLSVFVIRLHLLPVIFSVRPKMEHRPLFFLAFTG